ncbi:MAG: DUF1565 domain-containing protein, partial [Candidatus Promineifilaceae bacterium]|nr:DUF1565 domain-containing protein [Candidatus Promineifilaceae bacterium]
MNSKLSKWLILSALLVFLVAIFMAAGGHAAAAACTVTLSPGDDIQTAIDAAAPGDVICLDPGTYSPPAKIDIHQSVTLQGPQAGVDPRPGAGSGRLVGDTATEAIISGLANNLSGIIVITADNVVLDGLEITGSSGDMIDSEDFLATTGTAIRYNIIHVSGDEGIQL